MKRSTFARWLPATDRDYHEFSPPLLAIEATPPNPLGRKILWVLVLLLAALIVWSLVGRLEVVAVAEGKLVPQSYVKIVQPADSGIVREILVGEGESVRAGQVLMRMDTQLTDADVRSTEGEFQRWRLTLRRIDAELGKQAFVVEPKDPPGLAAETVSQLRANRGAHEAALAEIDSRLAKARAELASAEQVRARLEETLPYYREQDAAFDRLQRDGFAGPLLVSDKRRERIEKEQELKTQVHLIASAKASIVQLERSRVQLESDRRKLLHAERAEAQASFERIREERAKLEHRRTLLELTASQDAVVKDLATHTIGTVVQPGTVLLTLVPRDDKLRAEVWIDNEDIGFVRTGQQARVKLATFRFQKYGMVDGVVEYVSADAADTNSATTASGAGGDSGKPLGYRALIALDSMHLSAAGKDYPLSAGMQANAEIMLGTRTVAEYLLSPVSGVWQEAGRER